MNHLPIYHGGNSGHYFAGFIKENELYSPTFTNDDYIAMLGKLFVAQHPNFKKWIIQDNSDDFWEDFESTMAELGLPVRC